MEEDYIKQVNDKVAGLFTAPFKVVNGERQYLNSTLVSAEQIKMEMFVQAVGYDKKICDALLEPNNDHLRKEVTDMNFGDLAIKSQMMVMKL